MESTRAKVYVVIPNSGEIIAPLIKPIFMMACDNRFEVTLCDLVKSNRRGVHYNKNMTVKDFLDTDCEWYVSIDSDQIPLKNPLDLILSNREIIGMPTPIAANGFVVWNIFLNSDKVKDKYVPLQLHSGMLKDKKYPDLVECHAIGGGCIIVRREVFEKIYPPFLDKIDSDGGMDVEHDLEFCRKSREAGYHVFFSPYYRCEHVKKIPLLEILGSNNRLFMQEDSKNG